MNAVIKDMYESFFHSLIKCAKKSKERKGNQKSVYVIPKVYSFLVRKNKSENFVLERTQSSIISR